MGMTNGRTICSKHDEIMELASEIQSLCTDYSDPAEYHNLFASLRDKAEQIDQLAAYAKEDGQSMESGLDEKRERIEELEKEIEDYRKYDLEYQETIKTLEEELEDLKSVS